MATSDTAAAHEAADDPLAAYTISDADALRARYGEPGELAVGKELRHLDKHCVAFINLSRF